MCIRDRGNKVTTIQGEGDERTVRTVEKNVLPGSKWEHIETIQGINCLLYTSRCV